MEFLVLDKKKKRKTLLSDMHGNLERKCDTTVRKQTGKRELSGGTRKLTVLPLSYSSHLRVW